jgi:hypothetical protein
VELSLTRGRVCNLLLLLGLASAVPFGSESRRIEHHILFSQFFLFSQSGGPDPLFTSPRNRVAQLYFRALGCFFVASYDSQGYDGDILARLHTKVKVIQPRHRPHKIHLSQQYSYLQCCIDASLTDDSVLLYFSILLHCIVQWVLQVMFPSACSFIVLFHYMFRPTWPSSGV